MKCERILKDGLQVWSQYPVEEVIKKLADEDGISVDIAKKYLEENVDNGEVFEHVTCFAKYRVIK